MKLLTLIIMLIVNTATLALLYDEFEIQYQLENKELNQRSSTFINNYFTANNPDSVVEDLLKEKMSPIKREFMLHHLLTVISQQTPQPFFQQFVDQMKSYKTVASKLHDEGSLPVAVFNINSKAHGIENIWTAYRTEQRISQSFIKNLDQVITDVREIINSSSRPAWLGFKNSFIALASDKQTQFAEYLNNYEGGLIGLDRLASFVGLNTMHIPLLEKALASEDVSVREFTLRHLNTHLSFNDAKNLTINSALNGPDEKFSTSLLGQYVADHDVQKLLINQLNNKITADSAAFALSQVNDTGLHEQLKSEYLKNENQVAKNHILLALKLNRTASSNLVLDELQKSLPVNSKGGKWLKSFEGEK